MSSCETCNKKKDCADKLCMPLSEFIKKSRYVRIDWTEIICDGYEKEN